MHYSIVRELSHPASPHEVMLARDAAGNAVVLKRLRASRRDREDLALRLHLEAEILRDLGGAHGIVRLVALDDAPFTLAMEYVSGGSLADRLSDPSTTGLARRVSRALAVGSSILDALGYLHAHGVVHRDLKPSNVVFADDGAVRLIDFGVAARTDPTRDARAYGLPADWIEERVGTLPYAAPESVWNPSGPATPAHDVYAVAVLLYEMMTGVPPWNLTPDESAQSFVERIERDWNVTEFARIPGVPPRVTHALSLALHPDPHHRLASVRALAAELGLP